MTNQKIDILSPAGTLIRQHVLSASCSRKFSLMSEDSITLRFSTREAMQFPVGTSAGNFFITQEQVGKWNANTGVWDYELKFDAYYWLWANKILRYIIPGVDSARETSFSLTATIDIHANVILNCLGFLGIEYGGSPFRVDTTDTSLSREAKFVRYENLSVLGGIQAIAEAFGCEWWVSGNAIYFGRCEKGDPKLVFEAGINTSSITFQQAKSEAPNRLYVYGSERNLPTNYRKADGNDTIGGVVAKRLMLPEGTPYLQTDPDIPESQIVEKVVVLDSVYPRTDLTVSEEPDTYSSTTEDEEGNESSETYYRLKYGDSFLFSESYVLPNEELHVVFQSGLLNGMDFGVKFNPKGVNEKNTNGSWNPDAQMLEVVVNEDYGRRLPDSILKPQKGDKFILYGWDSTKMADLGLIADAEQELLEEGQKALEEYTKDLSSCTCPMAWDYMKPLFENNSQPKPGDVVTIIDTAHFGKGGRKSRIIGFEYKIDKPYAECVYTCGENISQKRLESIEKKIDGLAKSGSKVQIQNSLDFLSKRYSDRTPYRLSSDEGFEVGDYVAGASGAMIGKDAETGQTFGEMDRLFIRVKAFFETLTIINAETLAGKQYITPGGGIKCVKVEEVKDGNGNVASWRCYFLSEQDGEKTETKMIVGDQAISEMFNAKTGTSNKVSNHRYWRLVTAVDNDAYTDDNGNHYGYIELSASNCEAGSDAPEAGDVLCQLGWQGTGNADRQTAMVFSTVDADAPSIKMYSGIDSYSLADKAIISFGRDPLTNHVYFRLGNSTAKQYLEYKQNNGLKVAGSITTTSTIDGKTLDEYFTDLIPEISQEDIESYVEAIVDPKIEGIQNQIDGVIESFFGFGAPTLTNSPANEWTTDEARKAHNRDTYTDKTEYVDDVTTPTAGQSWRWQYTSPTDYGWVKIADSDATRALLDAAKAQDTADKKRRTFISTNEHPTPYPPYDDGDIWVNATYAPDYSNDILRCVTSKAEGQSFAISDWTLASKYTDDTLAQSAKDEIAGYQYIKEALKGNTVINGGLVLSTLIKLGTWTGEGDNATLSKVYAGMNGAIPDTLTQAQKGRTIASWWGGDMVDRFDVLGNLISPTPANAATALVRMDGSAYFSGGNVGFEKDGSGWFGDRSTGNAITFADGAMTFGNGIKINLGNGGTTTLGGISESLATVLNFINKLDNYLVPVKQDGSRTQWGADDFYAVKSVKGFYSEEWVSARGLNPWQSGGVVGASALADLTDVLLSNPTVGQSLVYNGSKWVNQKVGIDTSVLDDYALKSELVTPAERTLWNQTATNLSAILGSDSDNVINKYEEIVAFLDTYTEADTLANLLSNKADKATQIIAGTGLTGGGTLAADRTLSLATSGVTAGTYTKLTVDAYGRATAGASLAATDIPTLAISKIDGLQTAIDGKVSKTGDTMTGALVAQSGVVFGSAGNYINKLADADALVFGAEAEPRVTLGKLELYPLSAMLLGKPDKRWTAVYANIVNASNRVKIGDCEISWDADKGGLKFSTGIYSEGWISARGANADAGGGAVGLDWTQVEAQLTTNGYAKQSWVNQQGFLKSVAWGDVTGKPTWIGSSKPSYNFSEIGSKPTTLSGYGITDAKIANGVITLGGNTITPITSLAGYATQSWVEGKGYLTSITKAQVEAVLTGNITSHEHRYIRGLDTTNIASSVSGNYGFGYFRGQSTTEGIFPVSNNANGWITVHTHMGNYYHQLGFSSTGNLYHRNFTGTPINTTTPWNVILTSANISSYAITSHQSLANYVTLDGAQTITGAKTFTSAITSSINNALSWWMGTAPRGKFVATNGGNTNGWSPVLGFKTVTGKCEIGSLGDNIYINYYLDTRTTNSYDHQLAIPKKTGTLAVTSDLSAYLPLTGGTLTGCLTISSSAWADQLVIKRTNGTPSIYFYNSNTNLGGIYSNSNNMIFADANNVERKIWDSGNDGSGSGLDADLLDGVHNGSVTAKLINYNNDGGISGQVQFMQKSTGWKTWEAPTQEWYSVIKLNHGNGDTYFSRVLAFGFFSNRIYTHCKSDNSDKGWSTLAFTTDNVASATRLQGSYSLWGQTFYGNNVSGNMTGVGTIVAIGESHFTYTGGTYADPASGISAAMKMTGVFAQSGGNVLLATASGNVGIGTGSPAYKLDVNGSARINGNLTLGSGNSIVGGNSVNILKDHGNSNVTVCASYGDLYLGYAYTNNVRFYSGNTTGTGTEKMILRANGHLAVGTTTDSYALNCASFICDSWIRTTGQTGWYSETYGGGWYMQDTTYIKNYNSKRLKIQGISDYYGIWLEGSGVCCEGYAGSSWNTGHGALNVGCANNNGQTPLVVAYRVGGGLSGANRLFALELLNSGTELHFAFGGANKFKMTSGGCFHSTAIKLANICFECDNSGGDTSGRSSEINCYNTKLYIQHNSSTQLICCSGGGFMGVGTNTPGYKLDVSGVIHATVGMFSDGYVSARGDNSSDIRLKEQIMDFNATDIIRSLHPVSFKWNALARSKFAVFNTNEVQYGLIAQEAEMVAPWLVDKDMFNDGLWGVKYKKLIPVLLQAQKEVTFTVDDLVVRVKKLENENKELKRKIEILERR